MGWVGLMQDGKLSHFFFQVSKGLAEIETFKPKYVGILKTQGRTKISSNHRVEFLENLEEREIPGRYT